MSSYCKSDCRLSTPLDALIWVELQPRVRDSHFWWFATNGQYSAKLAYEGLFLGSTDFELYERV
jgi:hypothetical protein